MSGYRDSFGYNPGDEDKPAPEDAAEFLIAESDFRLAMRQAGMTVAAYAFSAFVLWLNWGWFLVPLGVPSLTIAHAAGVGVVSGVLTLGLAGGAKARIVDSPIPPSLLPFALPTYLLAIGIVCRLLMGAGL